MAFLGQTFDATAVEPSAPRELLPAGDYLVQIVESEIVETKAGDGQMLKLTLDIVDGPHAGRKLWDNLNLVNRNEQAVEIAQRTLSAICHATGKLQVSDSEALHFIPMVATVKTFPPGHTDKKGYVYENGKNEVGGYKPAGGARPAPAAQTHQPRQAAPQQQAQTQKPAAAPTPPWRRPAVAPRTA